jgi:hypothetical protein
MALKSFSSFFGSNIEHRTLNVERSVDVVVVG